MQHTLGGRHLTAMLVGCATVMACNGPDIPSVQNLRPEIVVVPETVDFGEQAVPVATSTVVSIANGGRAALDFALSIDGDDAGVYSLDLTEGTISPDDSVDLTIGFLPDSYLEYAAELVILSNDEEDPELRLPILGTGVAAPLPDIQLSALSIDFGEVGDEDLATEVLIVKNAGTAPLQLGTVQRAGSGAFDMATDPDGSTIAPGNELPVLVTYSPAVNSDGDNGTLTFVSDDPDEGEVEVFLIGNGGADFEYPVAQIDCPGTTAPPRFVRLDGDASYDPEGFDIVEYEWTLAEVPATLAGVPFSDAYITNANGTYTELFADAVGTYEVQLVVVNEVGIRSAPAICQIQAVPEEDILVELTWDTSNADLDLHVAVAGNDLFQTPGDASWCNPTPDWGDAGPLHDPSLDLDDRAGKGPENINIEVADDGMYDVRVHYFDDQGDDLVTATVRIYTKDPTSLTGNVTPVFEDFKLMARNDVWDVARINWPQGTAGTLSSTLYPALTRTCSQP